MAQNVFITKVKRLTLKSYVSLFFGLFIKLHSLLPNPMVLIVVSGAICTPQVSVYFYKTGEILRASDLVGIEIGFIFRMSYFQQHLGKSDFIMPLRVVRSGVSPLQL